MSVSVNNKTLQELDSILKPAIENAYRWSLQDSVPRSAIPTRMANYFRQQVKDNTRTRLSEKMHHIDLAMNQGAYNQDQRALFSALYTQYNPKQMSDQELQDKYIQKDSNGFQVFDKNIGIWVRFSEQSEINITIERNAESNNLPAVFVKAYDPQGGNMVRYIDHEVTAQDLYTADASQYGFTQDPNRQIEWKDNLYDALAMGNGAASATAGTLEAFMMGSNYRSNMFGNGGQWKALDGQWHNFKSIEQEANAFRQSSLKVSQQSAKLRGVKASNAWKVGGNICFFISVGFSLNNMRSAYSTNDSNMNDVFIKNTTDIVFSAVAFIPGIGWAISGTYFLLDAGGAFGNWGQASGFSREEVDSWIARDRAIHQQNLCEMDFKIPHKKSAAQQRIELMQQQREVARDKTYVAPRAIYSTKMFH